MKIVKNPKYLKKYNPNRRRPEHGLIFFVKMKNPWANHMAVYNADTGLFYRCYEDTEELSNTPLDIKRIKYWYVGLVNDEYFKF